MATACKTPVAAAVAVLLLLIAAAAVTPASASTITAYAGSGCSGSWTTWRCGCHNFDGYKEGYIFRYSDGQSGRFYNGWNCQGSYVSAWDNVRRCSPHSYNSVRIVC